MSIGHSQNSLFIKGLWLTYRLHNKEVTLKSNRKSAMTNEFADSFTNEMDFLRSTEFQRET